MSTSIASIYLFIQYLINNLIVFTLFSYVIDTIIFLNKTNETSSASLYIILVLILRK